LESLIKLLKHDFIAKQQSIFLKNLKTPQMDYFIVIADFAENYSFVLQDAAQGFHWTNTQATIHPFVIYYPSANSVLHKSFVVISDHFKHDTITLHCFQKQLLKFIVESIPVAPQKIIYFSDEAAAHYKNRKNFLNLAFHEEDFGIPAEWHFFATSHGKGPCDGVGGTVKRLAARTSLQKPYDNQIPMELYQWAKSNIHNIAFNFVSTQQVDEEAALLHKRFELACRIPGTQQLHAFFPSQSRSHLQAKLFSNSTTVRLVRVSSLPSCIELSWEEIFGYVTCFYEKDWWLGYVVEQHKQSQEVFVKFLHPSGPSNSFYYPNADDKLLIPKSSILTIPHPTTATGRTYSISAEEQSQASQTLSLRLQQSNI